MVSNPKDKIIEAAIQHYWDNIPSCKCDICKAIEDYFKSLITK